MEIIGIYPWRFDGGSVIAEKKKIFLKLTIFLLESFSAKIKSQVNNEMTIVTDRKRPSASFIKIYNAIIACMRLV